MKRERLFVTVKREIIHRSNGQIIVDGDAFIACAVFSVELVLA